MKNYLYLILFTLFSFSALADSVEIELEPRIPVMNEVFKIIFKVNSENGTDPVIQFNPRGLEILSKEQTGTSTQTTYVNGTLTVKREINIVYEAIATRSGFVYLDNIITNINGEKIRSPNQQINVSRVALRPQEIFVEAWSSKQTAYVNESILVRYYLYHKVPVTSTDVKKFPDLPKFMKRYHQESSAGERVTYKGEIYTRRVIYTAQVFASQIGNYKIDPIALDVAYSGGRGNLGGFGFGYGQMRSKSVRSKPIDIAILALPTNDVPKNFTGLIGKHTFSLRINKNQFVANEPIEVELKVKGPGALELMDAPKILDHPSIEQFEVNSDLAVNSDFTAEKTFSYTFLGRQNLSLENLEVPLSYFDEETKTYVTETLKLGDLRIVETSQSRGNTNIPNTTINNRDEKNNVALKENDLDFNKAKDKVLSPLYTLKNTFSLNKNYITYFLAILLLVLAGFQFPTWMKFFKKEKSGLEKYKKELTYQEFNELMIYLFDSGDYIKGIKNSDLKKDDKETLIGLVNKNAEDYMKKKKSLRIKIPTKVFDRLEKIANEANR